ncbi:hypothetical protein pb186bvf_012851 [Paramecium bursaria]
MLQSLPVNAQPNTENVVPGNITQIILPKLSPLAFSIIRGSKYQPQQVQVQQSNCEQKIEQIILSDQSYNEHNPPSIEQKIKLTQRQDLQEFVNVPYQEFKRKCQTMNHQDASILEFCSNKKCKQKSRFLCEFCIIDGLPKQDMKQKQSIILKQYQVNGKIKDNYNNLVEIYKTNTKAVDAVLLQCKTSVERLYSNIAKLACGAQFNELLYRIKQLGQILSGEQMISSIDGDLLQKLISEQPENFLYKEFGDIINAFNLIQKDIDAFNQTSIQIKQVIEELMKVKKKVQLQEKSTEEIIEEARSFIQQGQQEQAIEMLIDHLEEDRSKLKECEIRNTIGYGLYKQKSYDQAICQFEKAIEISSQQNSKADHYKYYYYIGKSQFKSYQTYKFEIQTEERAFICAYFLQNFQESIQLNPKFNRAYIQISNIYGDLNQTENQVKILTEGLQNNEHDYKLTIEIGRLHFKLNLFKEAQKYIDEALQLKPFDLKITQTESKVKKQKFNPIFAKGVILCNLGHYKEAYQILTQITKYDIYNDEAHYQIAICLYKLGEIDNALNILQQLAQKNKYDSRYDKLIDQILMPE